MPTDLPADILHRIVERFGKCREHIIIVHRTPSLLPEYSVDIFINMEVVETSITKEEFQYLANAEHVGKEEG